MSTSFSIGDFSRATHLTVKTLRHYHEAGLLVPSSVDPHTGYRRYTAEQISLAQLIRRFRSLNMPVEDVKAAKLAAIQLDFPTVSDFMLACFHAYMKTHKQG